MIFHEKNRQGAEGEEPPGGQENHHQRRDDHGFEHRLPGPPANHRPESVLRADEFAAPVRKLERSFLEYSF